MSLAIAIATLLTAFSSKDVPLAVVVRVNGHAQAGPAKALKPIKSGDVISKNWRVKTESDGKVLLRFLRDKALADINPKSLVELDVRQDEQAAAAQDLTVLDGSVAFLAPLGSIGNRTETATTVATAKSAQFGMSTTSDGQTRIDVLAGSVQVCNQMTGEHRLVVTGQSQLSSYDGFAEIKQIPIDSSLAKMDAMPALDTASTTTQLQVPFVDPVTGKAATLLIGVKRGR